jgi:hypothetical protein
MTLRTLGTVAGLCAYLLAVRAGGQSLEWCEIRLPDGPTRVGEDGQGDVYVAVCQTEGALVTFRQRPGWYQELYRGPLAGMGTTRDGTVWFTVGEKVFRHGPGDAAAVDRTAAFGRLIAAPTSVFATRGGDVYVAGAARYRGPEGAFRPQLATTDQGAVVELMAEDPFGNEWGLARLADQQGEVVTRQKLNTLQWTAVRTIPTGAWRTLLVDDLGYVWLHGGRDLLRLDPRHPDRAVRRFPTEELPAAVTAVARNPNRQVLAGLADGTIWELAFGPKGAERRADREGTGAAVRALYVDGRGRLWVVAGGRIGNWPAPEGAWQRDWEEVARLPVGNHDIIFARHGQRLLTAGGKTYCGYPAADWVNLDEIWSYDVRGEHWRVETPMLRPGKAYSGIAALAGEIWLIGGYLRKGSGTQAVADVEIYNPQSGLVRHGPALDLARGQVVALTIEDRLFAIGGATDEQPLAVMVSIAAGESTWRAEAAPPGRIEQASGCVLDGRIYVAAGERSGCPGLFVYDPASRQWSSVAHPTGKAPHAPLCAAHDGRIWVLGGWGGTDGRSVFQYDPRGNAWQRGPDLPLPLSWGAAIDVDGRLLVTGGAYRSDDVNDYFNSDRSFRLR